LPAADDQPQNCPCSVCWAGHRRCGAFPDPAKEGEGAPGGRTAKRFCPLPFGCQLPVTPSFPFDQKTALLSGCKGHHRQQLHYVPVGGNFYFLFLFLFLFFYFILFYLFFASIFGQLMSLFLRSFVVFLFQDSSSSELWSPWHGIYVTRLVQGLKNGRQTRGISAAPFCVANLGEVRRATFETGGFPSLNPDRHCRV
jgi:hypothetical protein